MQNGGRGTGIAGCWSEPLGLEQFRAMECRLPNLQLQHIQINALTSMKMVFVMVMERAVDKSWMRCWRVT